MCIIISSSICNFLNLKTSSNNFLLVEIPFKNAASAVELSVNKYSSAPLSRPPCWDSSTASCEDIHRVNLPLHAVELRQLPPYQLLEYLEKIWKVPS